MLLHDICYINTKYLSRIFAIFNALLLGYFNNSVYPLIYAGCIPQPSLWVLTDRLSFATSIMADFDN